MTTMLRLPRSVSLFATAAAAALSLASVASATVVLNADFTQPGVLGSGWTDNSQGNKFASVSGGIQHQGPFPGFYSYTLIHGSEATPTLFGGAQTITTVTLDFNAFLPPAGGGETSVGLVFGSLQIHFNRGDGYQVLRYGDNASPFDGGWGHTFQNEIFGSYANNNPGQLQIVVTNDGTTASAVLKVLRDGGSASDTFTLSSIAASNLAGGVVGIKGFVNNSGGVGAMPVYTGLSVDVVSTAPIPEPSAFAALAGLAVAGVCGVRRRRRA